MEHLSSPLPTPPPQGSWLKCRGDKEDEDASYLLLAVKEAARVMPGSLLLRLVGESPLPVLWEPKWSEKTLGWSSYYTQIQWKRVRTEDVWNHTGRWRKRARLKEVPGCSMWFCLAMSCQGWRLSCFHPSCCRTETGSPRFGPRCTHKNASVHGNATMVKGYRWGQQIRDYDSE